MVAQAEAFRDSVDLLKSMVEIPSVSGQEDPLASFLARKLESYFAGQVRRIGHNLVIDSAGEKPGPTLLFCSHIDTVAPAKSWSYDPFKATVEGDRIYGLGANDAGASVVSMVAAMRVLGKPARGRLVLCLAAEEEAGSEGFMKIESGLPRYDAAIFGEPTDMGMAPAMRGAMRVMLHSHGKACHASRPWEGRNAVDQFAEDLRRLRAIDVKDRSPWGGTTIQPTMIKGGSSPNQIPDLVEATLDIRTTPEKDNAWTLAKLKEAGLDIKVLFDRRKPMHNDPDAPLVRAIRKARSDVADYTFNGTCDMAFATAPSLVMGPGRSERSHAADEFIVTSEIERAIGIYVAVAREFLAS